MRFLVLIGCIAACTPSAVNGADRIAPGMKLDAVKRTLQSHGYEVNSPKYGLAMQSSDKHGRLEFCRIDDDITLVLNYDRRTNEVGSLSLIFFPENQTSKTNRLAREALEMRFEDGGVYTVKLKRRVDAAVDTAKKDR